LRASRRGVSEIVGAMIAITAMVVVGGLILYYYGQQASLAEERLAAARENVKIIPIVANGTLYALLQNVGSQPVEISYIILYNVTGDPQPFLVENVSLLLAPGVPGAMVPLVPEQPGRYEIVAVSTLGSVFRWDPEATGGDGVLDVPDDLTPPADEWDPVDILGPALAAEYGNMTVVNATVVDWAGVHVIGRAWAKSTSYSGEGWSRLTVWDCNGVYNVSDYSFNRGWYREPAVVVYNATCPDVEVNARTLAVGAETYAKVDVDIQVNVTISNPSGYYLVASLPAPSVGIEPFQLPRWAWWHWNVTVTGGAWDLVGERIVVVVPPGGEAHVALTATAAARTLVAATTTYYVDVRVDWPGAPILLAYLQPL